MAMHVFVPTDSIHKQPEELVVYISRCFFVQGKIVRMKKEPLSLEHKVVIDKALQDADVLLSEYSFANLYLFRKTHAYNILFADTLYIEGITYDNMRFIMPLGLEAFKDYKTLKILSSTADFLFPICSAWLPLYADRIQHVWAEDADSDYLYDVTKMAHYSGRHLAKKRNLEKQFLSAHTHEEKPLSTSTQEDALQVLRQWQQTKEHADFEPACEAVTLHETLGIGGMLFYSDNVPIGVILGGALTSHVYVIHFAKALVQYKGIYQYMYHRFSQTLEGRYTWLNMEQDLGDENLRKTKHSYQPVELAKKFRVKI